MGRLEFRGPVFWRLAGRKSANSRGANGLKGRELVFLGGWGGPNPHFARPPGRKWARAAPPPGPMPRAGKFFSTFFPFLAGNSAWAAAPAAGSAVPGEKPSREKSLSFCTGFEGPQMTYKLMVFFLYCFFLNPQPNVPQKTRTNIPCVPVQTNGFFSLQLPAYCSTLCST